MGLFKNMKDAMGQAGPAMQQARQQGGMGNVAQQMGDRDSILTALTPGV